MTVLSAYSKLVIDAHRHNTLDVVARYIYRKRYRIFLITTDGELEMTTAYTEETAKLYILAICDYIKERCPKQ